jgi:hypothetical protein
VRLPRNAAEWTALLSSVGFLLSSIGVSVPQWMRAEANKQASWKCTDELAEEKAEKDEWKDRWFGHQCNAHGDCQ